MKSVKYISLVFVFLVSSVAGAQVVDFTITPDAEGALRKCGEKTVFTVTALGKGRKALTNGSVTVRLDNFGPLVKFDGVVDLSKGNPFKMEGSLDKPGFLRLAAYSGGKGVSKDFSVGYEPERIVKGSPSPSDFDSFWADARKRFAKEVPVDARLEEVKERSTAAYTFYRASFATYGRRVYAFLSVPKDRSKAPFPVRIGVNAAGFGEWTNGIDCRPDAICAQFAVYDWQMDRDWKKLGLKKKYDELNKATHLRYGARYCASGITDGRESYYFYPVILGIDRAVDWIAENYPVDGRRFCYHGTSQGGGFGFYLCGLNRRFTRAALFVPAITDTMGYLAGRQSGWPYIVESNSSTPAKRAAAEKFAPYFDGANFASRITCSVRVAVGFSDVTCAPCAVYAAYNEIPVKDKAIGHGIGMTHNCFGRFYSEYGRWLDSD